MFSIVLVSYNSGHVIGDAIRSVPPGNQVIVVDNASTDDSIAVAQGLGAEVIALDRNFGFGTACNRGAAVARHEKLLFLNPDAVLTPDALGHLAAGFDAYPDSIAFNPRLLYPDGTQMFRRGTILLPGADVLPPGEVPTADMPVTMLEGSALLVRKSEFDKLGGFDENIFLYYEDDDLSARIVKSGHTMHRLHDAIVYHQPTTSTRPSPEILEFRSYQYTRARIYVCRKHGIPMPINLRILAAAYQWLGASLKGKKIKAATTRGSLRAYWEARKHIAQN